jgi:hypothetical protein
VDARRSWELSLSGVAGAVSNPFAPLPTEFSGPFLALRMTFLYNPDRTDFVRAPASPTGQSSSKSGIKVSISPPNVGTVPIGGSEVVDATVTGSTIRP